MDLHPLTIQTAHALLQKKEISAVELTRSILDRIEAVEPRIDAFLSVAADTALQQAHTADRMIASGQITPLCGIPLAVKDLICTKGLRTTSASRMLENFVPPYDATVIQKLKKAGAVIIGKTNMDEFGMGSTNENSAFKPTRNPWNLDRTPGGSSGGSAAAVAASLALAALGSDTGGSIRQPASHCGVVGVKPTYGRVSRYGLMAFASSLDQIGPLSKDVTDSAILLNHLCGHDAQDATSAREPVPDFASALAGGIEEVTIGIVKECDSGEGLHPDVNAAFQNAVTTLKGLGARMVPVSLPRISHALAAYYVIASCEASSNLARFDGVRYGYRSKDSRDLLDLYCRTRSTGFGPEVQRRIIIGTYALSAGYYEAYYKKASQVRTLIINDFKTAFKTCDVLLTPVTPAPAFKIGEKTDDPLTMYLSDLFTLTANMAGIPAMSVPCGFSAEGLPIGLHLMADHFRETMLLKTAWNFEKATDFHKRRPDL